jgi:hypothetical protein
VSGQVVVYQRTDTTVLGIRAHGERQLAREGTHMVSTTEGQWHALWVHIDALQAQVDQLQAPK